MLIYRVMHSLNGMGPYRMPDGVRLEFCGDCDNVPGHCDNYKVFNDYRGLGLRGTSYLPLPDEEGIYRSASDVFGFASLYSLRRWFHKDRRVYLGHAGYVVAVFEVPAEYVKEGLRQVAFDMDHAVGVETLDILL